MRTSQAILRVCWLAGALSACAPTEAIPVPTFTSLPPTTIPGECEGGATRIEAGLTYRGQIEAVSRPYPANCIYYCLWIEEGDQSLEFRLTDFDTDLDLFVGFGELSSLVGEIPTEVEGRSWTSNAYGSDDERIQIESAARGAYYIEVCSYEGKESTFELWAGRP